MKKIAPRNSLLILFLVAIVAVPLTWFTINKPFSYISMVEARRLSDFPELNPQIFLTGLNFQILKTGVKRIFQINSGKACRSSWANNT